MNVSLAIAHDTNHNYRRDQLIYILFGGFSILLFLKNAWVAEDAFIILRTVDQFLHGNGFRWNPHERTQAYTSPLWFLLIIASTGLGKALYVNLIALSLVLHIALLTVMAVLIGNALRWSAAVLLLTLSQAFFDFTASGLEYPLVYLLCGTFILLYLRNRHTEDRYALSLCAGLALVTRHDLLFLLAPMLLHIFWQCARNLSLRQWLQTAALFAAPFLLWSLFSLFYYGFPFPNTAYAKLAIPGLPQSERFRRGLIYLIVSLQTDPITPCAMAFAVLAGVVSRKAIPFMLATGITLGFFYIYSIGGDYMIGRFYTPLYLAAVLLLAVCIPPAWLLSRPAVFLAGICTGRLIMNYFGMHLEQFVWLANTSGLPIQSEQAAIAACMVAGLLLACLGLPGHRLRYLTLTVFACLLFYTTQKNDSPWQTPYGNWGKTADHDYWWMINTVSRERYWIYRWTSIDAWQHRNPEKPFPDHPWCHEGAEVPNGGIMPFAGMYGYCMNTSNRVIEPTGLVDPLIARMPKNPRSPWNSGGGNRIVPAGYLETLTSGENLLQDPDLARYYDKLGVLTRSDELFSMERIQTIILFNLGHYDVWLQAHNARALAAVVAEPQ